MGRRKKIVDTPKVDLFSETKITKSADDNKYTIVYFTNEHSKVDYAERLESENRLKYIVNGSVGYLMLNQIKDVIPPKNVV